MEPLHQVLLNTLAQEAATFDILDRDGMIHYLRCLLRPAVGLVADFIFRELGPDGYFVALTGRERVPYYCNAQIVLLLAVRWSKLDPYRSYRLTGFHLIGNRSTSTASGRT